MFKCFTEVAVSNAGLEGRQKMISFLFLLEQEAGVTRIRQVQIHSEHI